MSLVQSGGTKSDDVAVLARGGGVFPLLAEPVCDAAHNQQDDREVERIARRHEHGVEGPLDELANGGDDVLNVHGHALLARI